MHTPGDTGTAEDGFVRRDPDERRVVLRLTNFNFFAVNGKGVGRNHLRRIKLLRCAIFHLRAPECQLRGLGCFDVLDHLGRGDNFCVRESLHQRLEAEIEIRIAGGNDNAAQFLTAFADHIDQLFAIFHAKLRIKQHRFMRTGSQRRVHGEDTFILRVIGLQC